MGEMISGRQDKRGELQKGGNKGRSLMNWLLPHLKDIFFDYDSI
jgi:hypothetical protein